MILWVANLIQLGLRYSWGVAVPQASSQLKLNGFQVGLVASAFYAGYVATGIPSGYLVDRVGSKFVTVASLFGIGLLCFTIAFSESFPWLLASFFACGVVAGPIFPSSLKALAENLTSKSRATGVGALETVSPFAMIVAATVYPFVVEGFGWRQVYLGLGSASLMVCLAYFLFTSGTGINTGNAHAGSPLAREKRGKKGLFSTLTNTTLGWAVAFRLGGMWGIIALSAWFYDLTYSLTGPADAQRLYLLLASFAVMGQLVGGVVSDRLERHRVAVVGMLAFGLATASFSMAKTSDSLYFLAPLIGFTAFFWKSGLDTYIIEAVGPEQRGSAAGYMNTVSQLGSLFAPAAVGYALDATGVHTPYPFLVLAAGPLVSAVSMLLKMPGSHVSSKAA
jgi:MFS family permease